MRLPILALALLCLLSAAHAVSLSDFLKPYLLPGERFSAQNLAVETGNYQLVSISRKPTFLLSEQEDTFTIIADREAIAAVLRADAIASMRMGETVDESLLLLVDFNDSRQPAEAECRRLTGTDRFPCIDKDSCIVACRSVPNCETALSYSIDSIRALQNWLSASAELDTAVSSALAEGQTIGGDPVPGAADAALSKFEAARLIAANVSSNLIFGCGPQMPCYCKLGMNNSLLDGAIGNLKALRQNLNNLAVLDQNASVIADRTSERLAIGNEGEKYALVMRNAEDGIVSTREVIENSLLHVRDNSLLNGFNLLQGQLVQLRQSVSAKNYSQAEVRADAFFTSMNSLVDNASTNAATYRLLIDLQLNATRTLNALSEFELVEPDASTFDSLATRLAAITITTPLEPSANARFPTLALLQKELTSIAVSSAALLDKSEKSALESELANLQSQTKALEANARSYDQNVSTSSINQLMQDAEGKLASGDRYGARLALDDAKSKLEDEKARLDASIADIKISSQALADASVAIAEAGRTRFTLIQPDLSAAKAKLAEAQSLLYSQPEQSALLAAQASELANASVPEAQTRDQLAIIIAVVLGLAAAVGVLYWVYRREEG